MRLSPIILLSPGRSGSTLLQRYLNISKDIIIWGEHGGFIRGLAKTYYNFIQDNNSQKLLKKGSENTRAILKSDLTINQSIEWTNNFFNNDFLDEFRNFIINLLSKGVNPNQRWGFKEIRYGITEMEFLSLLFPQAQFIFIVRNPLDTISSMIFSWDHNNWIHNKRNNINKKILVKYCKRLFGSYESILNFINQENNYFLLIDYEFLNINPFVAVNNIFNFINVQTPDKKLIDFISNKHIGISNKRVIRDDINNFFTDTEEYKIISNTYEKFNKYMD